MDNYYINFLAPKPIMATDCVYIANEAYNVWFITTEIAVFWFSLAAFIIGLAFGYQLCVKYGCK